MDFLPNIYPEAVQELEIERREEQCPRKLERHEAWLPKAAFNRQPTLGETFQATDKKGRKFPMIVKEIRYAEDGKTVLGYILAVPPRMPMKKNRAARRQEEALSRRCGRQKHHHHREGEDHHKHESRTEDGEIGATGATGSTGETGVTG